MRSISLLTVVSRLCFPNPKSFNVFNENLRWALQWLPSVWMIPSGPSPKKRFSLWKALVGLPENSSFENSSWKMHLFHSALFPHDYRYLCELKIIDDVGLVDWSNSHSGNLVTCDTFIQKIVTDTFLHCKKWKGAKDWDLRGTRRNFSSSFKPKQKENWQKENNE